MAHLEMTVPVKFPCMWDSPWLCQITRWYNYDMRVFIHFYSSPSFCQMHENWGYPHFRKPPYKWGIPKKTWVQYSNDLTTSKYNMKIQHQYAWGLYDSKSSTGIDIDYLLFTEHIAILMIKWRFPKSMGFPYRLSILITLSTRKPSNCLWKPSHRSM